MAALPLSTDYLRAIANPRLALPLHGYAIEIAYLPLRLNEEQRLSLANYITTTLATLVRAEPDGSLEALSSVVNPAPSIDDTLADATREPAYVAVQYMLPGYSFALRVGPTTLQIRKSRTSLEDLVNTAHLLQKVLDRFFPPLPPEGEPMVHSLDSMLGLSERTYRISHVFESRLRVTSRVNNRDAQVTNGLLMDRLLSLKMPKGEDASGSKAPFAALQLDDLRRADVTIGGHKEIEGRNRSLWFTLEAPYNVTRRDVDLQMSYRMGEGSAELQRGDLTDLATPFVSFFRNLVLNRFLEDLFFDIAVEARL